MLCIHDLTYYRFQVCDFAKTVINGRRFKMKKYTTEEKIEFYKNKIKNLENKRDLELEIQDILRRLNELESSVNGLMIVLGDKLPR